MSGCVTRPLAERFWQKVRKGDGCWAWTAAVGRGGYGKISLGGKDVGRIKDAHRVSWELANGPIGDGLCVLHSCDNPPCVNPAHLRLGTQRENIVEAAAKGRMRRGERSPGAVLTDVQVRTIKLMRESGVPFSDIVRISGVPRSNVSSIVHHENAWSHIHATVH